MTDWLGLPTLASEHGAKVDQFILLVHLMMVAAFLGWGAWFALSVLRFRSGRSPKADYHGLKTRLPYIFVGAMALAEFALLLGMALPFWHDEINTAPQSGEDVVELRVIAEQFKWNVHYPGPDGIFGRTDISLIDSQVNSIGLDKDDPASEDDITSSGRLHIPVGRQILIHLSTKDVIHGFSLPEFRVKQDAIPGMRIPVYFRPTMTTAEFRNLVDDQDRDFEIACAQLCGLSHYTMRGRVVVQTEEEFAAWYEEELERKREYEDDDWF